MGKIQGKGDQMPISHNLVVWTCPEGHPCMTGFLAPLASTFRMCSHNTDRDEFGDPVKCDAVMVVAYDDRAKVQGPLTEFASEDDKRVRMRAGLKIAQEQLRSGDMLCAQIVEQLGVALKGIRKAWK
jgi:hypothetical protein